ncbi:Dephospho-CoA kinase CAB5 [Ceratocystis fimbriata CBS 114723]|uniref:Dephospho-CoA kinase CAB5 n=1 Tax=Ceratocystis fimbriata CBS 114723 TaxID=1035309 RepID=A0A2C5XH24_9PEZI|nr:Dephospho-CoA kinase CAB5 [Ceratocystis fimbriata CBS 114723]
MLFIGLTGSIATGKSTVSSILSKPPYCIPIIDADILARKVVEPGSNGYAAIVKYFGPTTPDLLVPIADGMPENGPEGKGRPLNRPALGRRVFGDSEERKRDRGVLNKIVHPAVRTEMYRAMFWYYLTGHWAVILDVPLLFESGLDQLCGTVVVVAVSDPEVQMNRLMERDSHLTREDAENRVRSQVDVRVKAKRCTERGKGRGVVLWNDGTREELEKNIGEAISSLKASSPYWWSYSLLACPPLGLIVGVYGFLQNVRLNRKWTKLEKEATAKL